MSKHREDIVLKDITNAAKLIAAFVEGFDKETFIGDWKTRSAVMYQLTVIGEAVKLLSPEFRLLKRPDSLAVYGGNARSPYPCL